MQGDQNPEGTDSEGAGRGGGEALIGLGAEGGGRPARCPAPNLGSVGERLVQRPRVVRRTAVHDLGAGVGVGVGPFPSAEAPRGPAEAPGAPTAAGSSAATCGRPACCRGSRLESSRWGGGSGPARVYGPPVKPTLWSPRSWGSAPPAAAWRPECSTPLDRASRGGLLHLGRLLPRKPPFPGRLEISQVDKVLKEPGTPREKIRPGCDGLPAAKNHDVHQEPLYQPQRSDPGLTS